MGKRREERHTAAEFRRYGRKAPMCLREGRKDVSKVFTFSLQLTFYYSASTTCFLSSSPDSTSASRPLSSFGSGLARCKALCGLSGNEILKILGITFVNVRKPIHSVNGSVKIQPFVLFGPRSPSLVLPNPSFA